MPLSDHLDMGDQSSCSLTCLMFTVWIGTIMLIVYSGIALATDSRNDLVSLCPYDDIWAWLLVMTIGKGIMVVGNCRHRNGQKNKTVIVLSALVSVLISIGLVAWGSIWVFSTCSLEHLRNTKVWYMSFIHLIIQYIILGVLLVSGIIIAIGMCISVSVSKDQISDSLTRV